MRDNGSPRIGSTLCNAANCALCGWERLASSGPSKAVKTREWPPCNVSNNSALEGTGAPSAFGTEPRPNQMCHSSCKTALSPSNCKKHPSPSRDAPAPLQQIHARKRLNRQLVVGDIGNRSLHDTNNKCLTEGAECHRSRQFLPPIESSPIYNEHPPLAQDTRVKQSPLVTKIAFL